MREIVCIIIVFFVLPLSLFAYTPTTRDDQLLDTCFAKIDQIVGKDPQKIPSLSQKIVMVSAYKPLKAQTRYIIAQLLDYVDEQMDLLGSTTHESDSVIFETATLPTTEKQSVTQTERYTVLKVVDGDTIDISYQGKSQRVRLIGIDAPESTTTRYGYSECFGVDARSYLGGLLQDEFVSLEFDPSQDRFDKYGRLLAYIFLQGANINAQLISEGYAWEYTYNSSYVYQNVFKQVQTEAKNAKVGLRATSTCNGERKAITNTLLNNNLPSPSSCPQEIYCKDLSSCEQARYYLTTCRLTRLDSDGDGIPCETLCTK